MITEQPRVPPALEAVFRRVLDQKSTMASLDAELKAHPQEVEANSIDQGGLREDMKAVTEGVSSSSCFFRVLPAEHRHDQAQRLKSSIVYSYGSAGSGI